MSMQQEPWLSVVSVVRDDADGLARSVASLALQDVAGVEFIVIDSSADPAAVEATVRQFPGDVEYSWLPPEGIFAAMNEGLAQCTGRFVYFLNAGDSLHEPSVLATVQGAIDHPEVTWAFGPVHVIDQRGGDTLTPTWDYHREQASCFSRGHFPPHQGTFVRTSVLREVGGFDTQYSIVADYAAFLCLSQRADPVVLGIPVARFIEGGMSTRRWKSSIREFHRARQAILRPRGAVAWRERFETVAQFSRMWVVRGVLRRGR